MKRCPTCNELVPRGHGYKKSQTYCSYKCYQEKTPKMIEAEKNLGKPIKEAMLEILNSSKNITHTAHSLGIDKPQLYRWMDKFGIKKVLYWE